MPTLSVVVPLFNEEHRVTNTARTLVESLDAEGLVEVVLVNDGSTDETQRLADEAARQDARVRSVELRSNRGKGFASRAGIGASRGDLVLLTDADLSASLEGFGLLRDAIDRGADFAIASRPLRGSVIGVRPPLRRELLGRAGNLLLRALDPSLRRFMDTQCGFKLCRGDAVRALAPLLTVDRWGFDFELLHVAVRRGYDVREVPVFWSDSADSRLGRFDHVWTLGDAARMLWNEARGRYGP